jgi:hypothetical protein
LQLSEKEYFMNIKGISKTFALGAFLTGCASAPQPAPKSASQPSRLSEYAARYNDPATGVSIKPPAPVTPSLDITKVSSGLGEVPAVHATRSADGYPSKPEIVNPWGAEKKPSAGSSADTGPKPEIVNPWAGEKAGPRPKSVKQPKKQGSTGNQLWLGQ